MPPSTLTKEAWCCWLLQDSVIPMLCITFFSLIILSIYCCLLLGAAWWSFLFFNSWIVSVLLIKVPLYPLSPAATFFNFFSGSYFGLKWNLWPKRGDELKPSRPFSIVGWLLGSDSSLIALWSFGRCVGIVGGRKSYSFSSASLQSIDFIRWKQAQIF